MKNLLALPLLAVCSSLFAQTAQLGSAQANLDVTNINPKVLTGGDMFLNGASPGFEVPRGSGLHTLYAGALWLGGVDSSGQLYVSQQTYRQGTPPDAGYWPGPICDSGIQGQAHSATWDKIWKVSKAEIQNHIVNYNTVGYTTPADIATWPGNGNTAIGEAAQLAPFEDLNGDGIYSPGTGEYPLIKGDQALYLILNDAAGIKIPTSPTANLEIHAMYYGYDDPANPELYNTLFTKYRIINRGTINLQQMHAGMWMDFDLGNWEDDYVGCDTLTNRFYAYNGDNDDEVSQGGYGLNPPVQSVAFLDRKMTHFMYYNNDFNDQGNPTANVHYYNYLRGIWKNGQQITYGGDGFTPVPGGNPVPADYIFPGDPATQTGWIENSAIPGDRRGIGSIGPFTLSPGQEFDFTVAYSYSRGNSNLNSVTQAQADANVVSSQFNALATSNHIQISKPSLLLQPNPASDLMQIQTGQAAMANALVRVTDISGRELLRFNPTFQAGKSPALDINSLSKGVYLVSVTSGGQTTTAKLVKL